MLLNFDEEPKYDYLTEEFKKAYNFALKEQGEKPKPGAFINPIFDWNVRTHIDLVIVGLACI